MKLDLPVFETFKDEAEGFDRLVNPGHFVADHTQARLLQLGDDLERLRDQAREADLGQYQHFSNPFKPRVEGFEGKDFSWMAEAMTKDFRRMGCEPYLTYQLIRRAGLLDLPEGKEVEVRDVFSFMGEAALMIQRIRNKMGKVNATWIFEPGDYETQMRIGAMLIKAGDREKIDLEPEAINTIPKYSDSEPGIPFLHRSRGDQHTVVLGGVEVANPEAMLARVLKTIRKIKDPTMVPDMTVLPQASWPGVYSRMATPPYFIEEAGLDIQALQRIMRAYLKGGRITGELQHFSARLLSAARAKVVSENARIRDGGLEAKFEEVQEWEKVQYPPIHIITVEKKVD